jgi:hypothetical protein
VSSTLYKQHSTALTVVMLHDLSGMKGSSRASEKIHNPIIRVGGLPNEASNERSWLGIWKTSSLARYMCINKGYKQ